MKLFTLDLEFKASPANDTLASSFTKVKFDPTVVKDSEMSSGSGEDGKGHKITYTKNAAGHWVQVQLKNKEREDCVPLKPETANHFGVSSYNPLYMTQQYLNYDVMDVLFVTFD